MKSLLPAESLKHHMAILGKTGSGKTSVSKAAVVEPDLTAKERVAIIDPTGAWWGLRLAADGKRPGFPAYVFGGRHADYPLLGSHGETMADVIGTTNTPAILDTSLMRTGERTKFFTDFADAILRKNDGPLRLVIDEAHVFMPQAGTRGSGAIPDMLHAGNNLISLGRSRGLRIVLISQRAAKLHKDSLTQVETLIALRLIAPQDRDAVRAWIADQADIETGKNIIAQLPRLSDGEGFVWAPESDFLKRIQFPRPITYDSSAAPTKSASAKKLSPVDLDVLKDRLAKVDQIAKEADPKMLRAEVARLKAEVTRLQSNPHSNGNELRQAYEHGHREARQAIEEEISNGIAQELGNMRDIVAATMNDFVHKVWNRKPKLQIKIPEYKPTKPMPLVPAVAAISAPKRQAMTTPAADMGGERKPLSVLASVHPSGMTKSQWAVASGIKSKGSTFATYLSRLRSAGRIEERGGLYFVSEQGLADLGGNIAELPAPGPALVDFWASKIAGVGPLLQFLKNEYPDWRTREAIANHLGISPAGSTLATYLSRIRSPGLIVESYGNIRLSESVMGA